MKEPIRVLHIVTHMNRGGLETMIMNYYRHIDRTKIQFDFLTHRTGKKDYDEEIEALGGHIYHLPALNPFSMQYRHQLKQFFLEHPEYQIVHSHLDCMSAIPLKYAKKAGVKHRIAHAHSTSQDKNMKFWLKRIYMQFIPKYATDLFACGHEAGKWMFGEHDFYILNNAIEAQQYGFDLAKSKQGKDKLGLKDYFVIGHVGRFSEPKNHIFLIDLFHEYVKQDESAKLLLIGDGTLKKSIEQKVQKLNLNEKVLFLGVRDDIPALMQVMDVFLFPSIYEGLPVTLIEAQASGLPCVISDVISDEVIVTDLIQKVSLHDDLNAWVEAINKTKAVTRKNTYEAISQSGFDVIKNVHELEKIYLGMVTRS